MNFTLLSLIFTKSFMLFLMLDPLGNTGIIAALLRNYPIKKQKQILRREVLIALFVMLLFYFGGSLLLGLLGISQAAIEMTGGFILFFFALNLLFPQSSPLKMTSDKNEPFIVPIAVPFIAGPSVLATTMLIAHEAVSPFVALSAIVLAWAAASLIILSSPLLMRFFGKNGIAVTEQLMGLLCALISTKMFFSGLSYFIHAH